MGDIKLSLQGSIERKPFRRMLFALLSLVAMFSPGIGVQMAEAHNHMHFQDIGTLNGNGPAVYFNADQGWANGYNCGGVNPQTGGSEPCVSPGNYPYFRAGNTATRAQLSKMVVNAKLTEGAQEQNPLNPTFADVPYGSTFYTQIETMYYYGWISGYACGGSGEPCDAQNRPYFRPNNPATRGQFAKILSRAMNQIRMYVAPSNPSFSDVPTSNVFYSYVETAYGHYAMRKMGAGYFGVADNITRGDIAYGLFSATSHETEFAADRPTLYVGSNNWEHPSVPSCYSPDPGPNIGYRSTVSGNLAGYTQNYGAYSNYGVIAREILFDNEAKYYHSCVAGYKPAIVFHVFDNPGGSGNCQDGNWDDGNFVSNLPSPVVGWATIPRCFGFIYSEYRIRTEAPANLDTNSPQYFAYHAWTPTDSQLQGEINVDNYQLNPNNDPVDGAKDNMAKFCYRRTDSAEFDPDNKYGIFRCP